MAITGNIPLSVEFNDTSTVNFYINGKVLKEQNSVVLQLDPTELKTVFGAYQQMEQELEDK